MLHRVTGSPLGNLTIAIDCDGALAGLYMEGQRHFPPAAALGVLDETVGAEVVRQLEEYFGGRRTAFELQLRAQGTAFQESVWEALRTIPYGQTRTYGQLAAALGRPGAARAVGGAVGRNPIGVVVPCHRVVGGDGTLTGYAGGAARKQTLLQLEARAHRSPIG